LGCCGAVSCGQREIETLDCAPGALGRNIKAVRDLIRDQHKRRMMMWGMRARGLVPCDGDRPTDPVTKVSIKLWIIVRTNYELDLRHVDFATQILVADEAFRRGELKDVRRLCGSALSSKLVDG
jgi:hypothetical protein